ncbi:MAG: ABC transporter ATP-binding protein [Planctomycetota bacterium]|nr:ABC transporter ATP-binding protein [Planctomycetota bacterium]
MTAILSARNITKTYKLGKQDVPVLRGINLDVDDGEMVALLGQSGAGKSTLLYLLGLLDRPTSGSIQFAGTEVNDLSPNRRAALRHAEIGFVFQFYHLIPELSALQNVKLGLMMLKTPLTYLRERGAIHQRAVDLLTRVGLAHRLKHRPNELSGGERQRVAIARALISEPRIILADEPTGNLDSETAEEVLEIIFQLNREQNIAFMLVTHNEELASRCDRTVRLKDGLVIG